MSVDVDKIIADNTVVIFSRSSCPFCKQVKELFSSLKVKCVAVELEKMGDEGKSVLKTLFEKTKRKTLPNVFVNGHHVGGRDATLQAHADGRLRDMLQKTYREHDYDLIVIGGGCGGLAAAREAAAYGKKVLLCDYVPPSYRGSTWGLGGTCVNSGCIPKRLLQKAGAVGRLMQETSLFGCEINGKPTHDWKTIIAKIRQYAESLDLYYNKTLKEENIRYDNAIVEFADSSDSHKVKVTQADGLKNVSGQNIVIAVGGRPRYPDIPGATKYGITSDDLFNLPYSPGKTLIVGASHTGLEFAGILVNFGLDVTVIDRDEHDSEEVFDKQMSELVALHLTHMGVKLVRPCFPESVELILDGTPPLLAVYGQIPGGLTHYGEYNTVLFACGRVPNIADLHLDVVGVEVDKCTSKIIANEQDQTNVPHIYVVGDARHGRMELASIAIKAGQTLAQRLYGGKTAVVECRSVPFAVLTPLEYGGVGLTEEAAEDKYGKENIEVFHTLFTPLDYSIAGRPWDKCYMKLICVSIDDNRVVGLHALCPNAETVAEGYAMALRLGATKADFDLLVGVHPTSAEIFTSLTVRKATCCEADIATCCG